MAKVLIIKRVGFEQTTPAATWTITHNLNLASPVVDVWITNPTTGSLFQNKDAYKVEVVSPNSIVISFDGIETTGTVLVT